MRGADNANWRGGRTVGGQDSAYILVWAPDHPAANRLGYVLEHRLVAEQALGRPLRCDEVVHHIDGDTHNNVASNLRVMTQSEHMRLHATEIQAARKAAGIRKQAERAVTRVCERCATTYVVTGKKSVRLRFCSASCYRAYRLGRGQLSKGLPA